MPNQKTPLPATAIRPITAIEAGDSPLDTPAGSPPVRQRARSKTGAVATTPDVVSGRVRARRNRRVDSGQLQTPPPTTTSPQRVSPARVSPAPGSSDAAATPESFLDLGVPTALVDVLNASGITEPFPIQCATISDALAGRDVLGQGRTGSGKTLAFALPLVARLAGQRSTPGSPRGLVLSPTRELATQIADVIAPLANAYGMRVVTVFGGVPQGRQRAALTAGADIVVACPGRLLDLHSQGALQLGSVQVCVIDEADMMADHGFLPSVRRILDATAKGGQRLLFSATLADGVDALASRYLNCPAEHTAAADAPQEALHRLQIVAEPNRVAAVAKLVGDGPAVVFCRTKYRAKALARKLNSRGVAAVELHGNLSQPQRERNLAAFTSGRAVALVATDIAARGIHVDAVAIVIHADPPAEHTAYLHRSGRTARAGAAGHVVTVVTDEQLADVRKMLRRAGVTLTGGQR